MKTMYQFLHFVETDKKPKTSTWSCRTRGGDELGTVKWYSSWRQYCYFPTVQAVYSAGCMEDIAAFCKQLNAVQKTKWQGEAAPAPDAAPVGCLAGGQQ